MSQENRPPKSPLRLVVDNTIPAGTRVSRRPFMEAGISMSRIHGHQHFLGPIQRTRTPNLPREPVALFIAAAVAFARVEKAARNFSRLLQPRFSLETARAA